MIQTIIGIVFGGGFIAFVQFLIQRSDDKTNQYEAIVKSIASLQKEMEGLREEVKLIDEKADQRQAVNARVRILRFADELLQERMHTKDSFDQCMSDIDVYEKFCDDHPKFKNNQTASTIEYVNRIYKERLAKHDFL